MGKPKDRLNIRKPIKSVGQLYPVLLSKDGRVIDGRHRLENDHHWRTETLEHIDSEEKILLARAISNWHRRSISRDEKIAWINGLAQLYIDQGLKVYGKSENPRVGAPFNEILNRLMKELGVCRQTITTYLEPKYKQTGKGGNQGGPRVSASQSIRTIAKSRPRLAGNLVERHEKEIREKLLHDEVFRKDVLLQIEREALAMEDEAEDDPELQALTTQNFNNVIFQYQDGLRQMNANPTLGGIFDNKERYRLKSYGIIERQYKVFRVYMLTPEAQKVLLNI